MSENSLVSYVKKVESIKIHSTGAEVNKKISVVDEEFLPINLTEYFCFK